ncbi:cobalamin biosynthesis protein [Acetobacter cibinongensis]|uniref:cobalamin biosynthesis protein n=1 Tax=Acetobacter cibinongensis TaxID=146475 RepID=UPI0013FE3EC6|nr:cobalamin biosynthesis protein [Acetobacter cibinongensis]
MEATPAMITVAGLGWNHSATPEQAMRVLRIAMQTYSIQKICRLAVPDFKKAEWLAELAHAFQAELVAVPRPALIQMQPLCLTHSDIVAEATRGVSSIAEACALAVAGHGRVLYGARQVQGGVTCALAKGEGL